MKTDEVCGRPLDPFAFASECYYMVVLIEGTKGTLTKNFRLKPINRSVRTEGFQRAIGKPFGRLRRGEIPASTQKISMQMRATQSRKIAKGGQHTPCGRCYLMPMDGLTLGFATREMNAILPGGRIDRITQPEKDTIVLLVRAGAANHRLLLCASPNNARCHFTNLNFPNPLEPPMFCMLLRKQILSGRILSIRQMHGDRVIHVDIDTVNELGDHVLRRLVLEIMGRHSNLMLLDEDGRILEAARHVSADMSRVRQIQPGLPYLPPPAQDKIAPEDADAENLLAKLEAQGDVPLQKALAASVSGLSNPAAKELAYRVLPAGCDRALEFLASQSEDLLPSSV